MDRKNIESSQEPYINIEELFFCFLFFFFALEALKNILIQLVQKYGFCYGN